jgi:two-component system chemotaxis response regulator CheY
MSIKDKLHIMVVDDMSTSRAIITQGLDELGIFNYSTENSGFSAFNRLSVRPVHLVLSDYNMPGLNGLELLRELRKNPKTQKIGFIMITGSPTHDVVQMGKALRINSILKKPFTTMQLRDCIEKVVGKL